MGSETAHLAQVKSKLGMLGTGQGMNLVPCWARSTSPWVDLQVPKEVKASRKVTTMAFWCPWDQAAAAQGFFAL